MRDDQRYRDFVVARAPALRRTAFLVCGDWHRAEDAVQAVLVQLYVRPPRVWDAADAWVRTALVRKLVDESRRSWRRREHPTDELPERAALPDAAHGDRDVLLAALRLLPARQRAVVVLRYWEDMSVTETAAALDLNEGTVKSHASRGLAALRLQLEGTVS
jgi:RNA polymerase sigma-70 factor (sigma-E family)